ncbi:PH domain-containing protein [Xenorhabdus entomophaga]|uniref:PH domain-containing protein n=1 Tax=Xenorhabdus entomophaga TaxID=3136257 RepID=UPI0030F39DA7
MINYKTATKDELKKEFKRLAEEVSEEPFFVKKEFFHLPHILSENEAPLAIASGMMDGNTWLITLTNKRVIFLDKGMIFGVTQVDINLEDIASVGGKTGIIMGEIIISTSGQNYKISSVLKSAVIPFTNLVNKAKEDKKTKTTYNVNHQTEIRNSSEDDIISKLERLAVLKEKGILSDGEFLVQKEKILNS